ncbi:hypothetical protein J25TS5_04580 [Paenibacillus faecis]|nr:hypothetical protein [Paenibacillus faecis]GIO83526.1 hypothetical protein J25TS5_04580 [Paenibacillus faecis]
MDVTTQKVVNETIVSICFLIQEIIKSDSATDMEQLPSLVAALASLVRS